MENELDGVQLIFFTYYIFARAREE
jgi:hypothetical protein